MTKLPYRRLFIANRGEVCRRIASTAKRLGLETVTITMDTQEPAFLASVVDVLVEADATIANPYLDIAEIIRLCKATGADAVHPGFGFLSENDAFASACIDAGLIWVGPNPASIKAMASKASARDIAVQSAVPVNAALQGIELKDQAKDLEKIKAFAEQRGFPLLVKAAFGGGGKGMRLVEQESGIEEAVLRCHSEAKSSFGNGQLLVEKYIRAPRHIEVQIMGDKQGNVYAIGDRDCSLQRRHQKIIEEAPAPLLDEKTRQDMHQAAVSLAKNVGYDSAGTVEFLVEGVAGQNAQSFYFLEMNTRLQVEHPVTEEVFGLDLVELQLRVAAGESLPALRDLQPHGWSVEARIYAEDCENNFLPSPARVDTFLPYYDLGIRWEVGIDRTDVVSSRFDPMIAKCIATGPSRLAALDRLKSALQKTVLFGPKNNLRFLCALLATEEFRKGGVSTHFIADRFEHLKKTLEAAYAHYDDRAKYMLGLLKHHVAGTTDLAQHSHEAITVHAFQQIASRSRETESFATATYPEGSKRTWGSPANMQNDGGPIVALDTTQQKHKWDESITVTHARIVDRDHRGLDAYYTKVKEPGGMVYWLSLDGVVYSDRIVFSALTAEMQGGAKDDQIKAPVPGKIVQIKTTAGANLEKDHVIVVLESMKMEFEIKATRAGKIHSLSVTMGQQVTAGQTLAIWEN